MAGGFARVDFNRLVSRLEELLPAGVQARVQGPGAVRLRAEFRGVVLDLGVRPLGV